TSTVYPDVQFQDTDHASLQPLLLSVYFSGTLPRHLVQGKIPIQISVRIEEEYRSFTAPVVEAITMQLLQSEHTVLGDDVDAIDDHPAPPSDVTIPFLPLSPLFNPASPSDWAFLSRSIQNWLLDEVNTESPQWSWGRDAFWISFIGGHPFFPRGKWPLWNARIPLEGEFIEQWM
ncbi:hypothetical protein BV22DRAFT_969312, partial [Leucogyrophana mollusca]